MLSPSPHSIRPTSAAGFTLIELAIVVVILSLLLGGGLSILEAKLNQSRYNETTMKMDAIEQALQDYALGRMRLPCPASVIEVTTNTLFGAERHMLGGGGTGDCSGGGITVVNSNWATGAVPTKPLNLPDDYMFDGWGRRFEYGIVPQMTAANAITTYPIADNTTNSGAATVKTSDIFGGVTITIRAMMVVLSHGPNGHGGYTRNGTRVNAEVSNMDELDNCNCTSAAAAGTIDAIYIQKLPTEDSNPANNFDDIVRYYMRYNYYYPSSVTAY